MVILKYFFEQDTFFVSQRSFLCKLDALVLRCNSGASARHGKAIVATMLKMISLRRWQIKVMDWGVLVNDVFIDCSFGLSRCCFCIQPYD